MSNKQPLSFVIVGVCLLVASPARAATVYLEMLPLTGELRLRNKATSSFDLAYYSIRSASGALNGSAAVWTSISSAYDKSGNKLIDPLNDWAKISSSTFELAEGVLSGGGTLPGQRAISLGKVWNPNKVPVPDLNVEVFDRNGVPQSVTREYALAGDYFPDGTVNQQDFNLWRQTFGSTGPTSVLLADGNLDGTVNAADYAIWRDNLGKSIAGFAFAEGAQIPSTVVLGSVVPEPKSAMLMIAAFAIFGAWFWNRRPRRAECRVLVRR